MLVNSKSISWQAYEAEYVGEGKLLSKSFQVNKVKQLNEKIKLNEDGAVLPQALLGSAFLVATFCMIIFTIGLIVHLNFNTNMQNVKQTAIIMGGTVSLFPILPSLLILSPTFVKLSSSSIKRYRLGANKLDEKKVQEWLRIDQDMLAKETQLNFYTTPSAQSWLDNPFAEDSAL